jgi:hypothetical protein
MGRGALAAGKAAKNSRAMCAKLAGSGKPAGNDGSGMAILISVRDEDYL